MRRHLATVIIALVAALGAATGSAYAVHAADTSHAVRQSVTDFNDGFTDGVCTGSERTAHDAYGINCTTGGHN
jgi:ABC-type sugar transport system substrate-binding protein